MKDYLTGLVREALTKAGLDASVEIALEKPKLPEHGDLSTNVALTLAKEAKRNPRQLATDVVAAMDRDEEMLSEISIAGPGFINFRFSDAYLRRSLAALLERGPDYGRSNEGEGRGANVEWVSANPTGPLHAGHGRQICIGATVCSLLEWTGWKVVREYYFNNAGNQIQNLANSVRERYKQRLGLPFDEETIAYKGEYIESIAEGIEKEFGGSKVDATDDFFKEKGIDWCFTEIKKALDRLKVYHDVFFNEDSLYKDGKIADVLERFKERGLTYEHEGAIWLKTTEFGTDKDRVIVKQTGEPTYRLPDIAYHRDKIQRGYDKIIDIFGADHIATIPDVLSSVKALGLPADHIDVIIHQMVSFINEGEAVKMSKRSGNVYYLNELIDDVGADAVRYFFVMRGSNSHLEFDIALAKERSEKNPVYYVQYAHARIASILRFAESEGATFDAAPNLAPLAHPAEFDLIKQLLEFPDTVAFCARTYEIQHLCTYLQAVATAFHKFYHECRVVTEDKDLSAARLLLCKATKTVLANGFVVLGVSAPEKM